MEERKPPKHEKKPRPARRDMRIFEPTAADKNWRTVEADHATRDAISDLIDLCCRPPRDEKEKNRGDHGSTNGTSGLTTFAVEALYDHDTMEKAKASFQFQDGADVVQKALAGLYAMEDHPDRYRYTPTGPNDTPARDPGVELRDVAHQLATSVERDFGPEIEEIKKRLAVNAPPPQ